MRRIFDYISWGFFLLFLGPAILIVASWKSLPGDSMYSVKLALEDVLLFFAKPSYAASGTLHVKYTQRRLSEATMLLSDRASTEGLVYFEQEVSDTRAVIAAAPNQKAKKELAVAYLATLRQASQKLEVQKQEIVNEPPARAPAPSHDSFDPTAFFIDDPGTPTQEIEETQETIQETIEELEEVAEEEPEETQEEDAPGNSENAPGQENDDSPPGNSEDAPGQNDETQSQEDETNN